MYGWHFFYSFFISNCSREGIKFIHELRKKIKLVFLLLFVVLTIHFFDWFFIDRCVLNQNYMGAALGNKACSHYSNCSMILMGYGGSARWLQVCATRVHALLSSGSVREEAAGQRRVLFCSNFHLVDLVHELILLVILVFGCFFFCCSCSFFSLFSGVVA